ncbi:MAG: TIGR03086 family protein [Actinobacteria bacterium]|nr:TIGR03086 family protein [Actinomycetota bacterium]
MDQLATLEYSLGELRGVVATLDDSQMDTVTNCEPWTVRRLTSHALNNQLLWAGLVTGRELVSAEDTMGAVPLEGDLAPVADEVVERAMALWRSEGVLAGVHPTPFGELPGSVVVNFATVDAIIHAWDLSASVGRPIEFEPDAVPAIAAVVEATCNDAARAAGLIQAPAEHAANASDTERLVAAAGRRTRR